MENNKMENNQIIYITFSTSGAKYLTQYLEKWGQDIGSNIWDIGFNIWKMGVKILDPILIYHHINPLFWGQDIGSNISDIGPNIWKLGVGEKRYKTKQK